MTIGHVDIIDRGARLFDRIIVAIAVNAEKAPMFTMDERVDIAREVFKERPNVEVDTFEGLLVNYVARRRANVIVRGLRAVSDFEYEFQLAGMNRHLYPEMETIFLTPSEQHMFISATLVREIAALGGDVSKFVHPVVAKRLKQKAKT